MRRNDDTRTITDNKQVGKITKNGPKGNKIAAGSKKGSTAKGRTAGEKGPYVGKRK